MKLSYDKAQILAAERWLSSGCPDDVSITSKICVKAAQEMGRRSNLILLMIPLAMLAFISTTPAFLSYWFVSATLYVLLFVAVLARIYFARELVNAVIGEVINLSRYYRLSIDVTAFTWSTLVGMLILFRGIDPVSELALIASLAITSGAFSSLTLEMSLWMRFNFVLWSPLVLITGIAGLAGKENAWFLLVLEFIFLCFAIFQGRRVVREYIHGLLVQSQLEDALSKIEKQRDEIIVQRGKMDSVLNRMHRLSYYDQLTGIGSRHHFYKKLETNIEDCKRDNQQFALLHLDLDGFKDINETFGHDLGDKLLKVVSQRACTLLRASDFAARLGSDELVLLINDFENSNDILGIAQRCLNEIHQPVDMGGELIAPKACIGLAIFPQDGENSLSLLKACETALHVAKTEGSHRYVRYALQMSVAAKQRLTVDQEMRNGLINNQFELYYQPQVNNNTFRACGVEALIRWNHPERGILSPLEFIQEVENAGMIDELGEWVLRTACQQAASWFKHGLPEMTIAVNISPLQLLDLNFATLVDQILQDTGLNPGLLEMEITESAIQTDIKAQDNLSKIRKLGVSIALDDFGTGYSSLASIKELPIDRIKIDRLFIIDMLKNTQDIALLSTIVEMAHVLNCSVVVEGVEEQGHVEKLQALDCDCMQGYYFSRPVEAWKIPQTIQEISAKSTPDIPVMRQFIEQPI